MPYDGPNTHCHSYYPYFKIKKVGQTSFYCYIATMAHTQIIYQRKIGNEFIPT